MSDLIFEDAPGGIAVALLTNGTHRMLGLRWCSGNDRVEPWPGHATGYFLVPVTFGAAIGRTLIQLKTSKGLSGFNEAGFDALVAWLVELQAIDDALCY